MYTYCFILPIKPNETKNKNNFLKVKLKNYTPIITQLFCIGEWTVDNSGKVPDKVKNEVI